MKSKKNNFISHFLWSIAGFNKSLIEDSKVDRFHAKIIGVLLLIVGVYATLAWSFFFQTVSDNFLISLIGGLFMGYFILSFDRALIASLSSGKTKLFSLIFRLILAFLLGIFLSQPMILKFYQHEIKKEASIIFIEKIKEQKIKLDELYNADIENLMNRKSNLQHQLTEKEKLFLNAEKDFKQEMDGTGGTKKRGYSTISKQKEKIYTQHKSDLNLLKNKNILELDSIQKQLNTINNKVFNETEKFKVTNTSFGTLIQVEALHSLLNKDKTGSLKSRYYLLSLILILIELSALIAKLLFSTNSYKGKVRLQEELELIQIANKKEITIANFENEKELIIMNNKESLTEFFKETKAVKNKKILTNLSDWEKDGKTSFTDFWNRFKTWFILN